MTTPSPPLPTPWLTAPARMTLDALLQEETSAKTCDLWYRSLDYLEMPMPDLALQDLELIHTAYTKVPASPVLDHDLIHLALSYGNLILGDYTGALEYADRVKRPHSKLVVGARVVSALWIKDLAAKIVHGGHYG